MTPFISEIVGTFLLMVLGLGVNANVSLQKTYGNGSGWIVITTGWAFAVYTGVVVAGPYSGAHINPAVSFGLAAAGEFPWSEVPSYILAQFIGAMFAAFCVWLVNKDHFDATEDGGTKRGVFCTAPAIPNTGINLFSEILGTFVLVFSVLYFTDAVISTNNEIIGLGSLGALPVSLIVWGIGLSLGGTTGYAINPARDLGPRIVHALLPLKNKGSNGWGYAWIPVVGPILGGVIAAWVAMLLQ
ncbi:MAG: aquaporin family protein [Muricauda sp.]|jgi:glycerol uptake facilitator protein|nr:MIP/aquaporin family protein [Allomuricauda sp.]MBO6587656.1 aquaporin family protein [Allomuricauda sp.]MBO6617281.1 aquaporin family protein [Allomuricauda sp.]MBO6643708.1 aquaporin family protein [Allomuricauda sp.]MBO6745616.1 aquaporin family protein [Allomuricauda sp.]MBO6843803.1 aquaporin family protein [Allomuricauda sp.]